MAEDRVLKIIKRFLYVHACGHLSIRFCIKISKCNLFIQISSPNLQGKLLGPMASECKTAKGQSLPVHVLPVKYFYLLLKKQNGCHSLAAPSSIGGIILI